MMMSPSMISDIIFRIISFCWGLIVFGLIVLAIWFLIFGERTYRIKLEIFDENRAELTAPLAYSHRFFNFVLIMGFTVLTMPIYGLISSLFTLIFNTEFVIFEFLVLNSLISFLYLPAGFLIYFPVFTKRYAEYLEINRSTGTLIRKRKWLGLFKRTWKVWDLDQIVELEHYERYCGFKFLDGTYWRVLRNFIFFSEKIIKNFNLFLKGDPLRPGIYHEKFIKIPLSDYFGKKFKKEQEDLR